MQLKTELAIDLEKAKQDIEGKVGTIVTEVNKKVSQVDQGMIQLTEAGKKVME